MTVTKSGSYYKSEVMSAWRQLPTDVNPLRYMTPIGYKQEGSKYGACGIRIDGTPEFVDAVLGKLKELLDGENAVTRLELARRKVQPVVIRGERKTFQNSAKDAEVCYIRLHERGDEGSMVECMIEGLRNRARGKDRKPSATERYAQAVGLDL